MTPLPTTSLDMLFVCPKLCDCVIDAHHVWSLSQRRLKLAARTTPNLVELLIEQAARKADFDQVTSSYTIRQVCEEHRGLDTADALWNEIQHFHGETFSPATCKCQMSLWRDDREDRHLGGDRYERTQYPNTHPFITKACAAHKHLLNDPVRHRAIVLEELARMQQAYALTQAASRPQIEALAKTIVETQALAQAELQLLQQVPFTFDRRRRLLLHTRPLAPHYQPIAQALSLAKLGRVVITDDWTGEQAA